MSFISQLECAGGLAPWAVYVALQLPDAPAGGPWEGLREKVRSGQGAVAACMLLPLMANAAQRALPGSTLRHAEHCWATLLAPAPRGGASLGLSFTLHLALPASPALLCR